MVIAVGLLTAASIWLGRDAIAAQSHNDRIDRYQVAAGVVLSQGFDIGTDADGTSYHLPNITYRYNVDGNEYESQQIATVRFSLNPDTFAKIYAVGNQVPVYYDPLRPAESLLLHRIPYHVVAGTRVAAGIVIILAAYLWIGLFLYIARLFYNKPGAPDLP